MYRKDGMQPSAYLQTLLDPLDQALGLWCVRHQHLDLHAYIHAHHTYSSSLLALPGTAMVACIQQIKSSGDHSRGESPSKLSMSLVVKLFSSNRPRRYDT